MSNPEILITPSPAEYERLIRDLETLRESGASSNTAAIIEAVSEKASSVRRERVKEAA